MMKPGLKKENHSGGVKKRKGRQIVCGGSGVGGRRNAGTHLYRVKFWLLVVSFTNSDSSLTHR